LCRLIVTHHGKAISPESAVTPTRGTSVSAPGVSKSGSSESVEVRGLGQESASSGLRVRVRLGTYSGCDQRRDFLYG
jgi:hypothetical protein